MTICTKKWIAKQSQTEHQFHRNTHGWVNAQIRYMFTTSHSHVCVVYTQQRNSSIDVFVAFLPLVWLQIADCLYLKWPLTRVIYHVNYLCQYIILIDEFVFFPLSLRTTTPAAATTINPFNQEEDLFVPNFVSKDFFPEC